MVLYKCKAIIYHSNIFLCFTFPVGSVLFVPVPFPLLYMIPLLFRFKRILPCVWTCFPVLVAFLLNAEIISVIAAFALVIVNLKYGFWYHFFCWLFCHRVVASFAEVFVCLALDHRKETLTWANVEDLVCEYINLAVKLETLESKIKLKFKL